MRSEAELLSLAGKARERAYCPYSNFSVGAALLCADGTVYQGCNIENASFGAGICAERAAFSAAVSDGRREFSAIAIVGGDAEKVGFPDKQCPPCGICRQFMSELCRGDFHIILGTPRSYSVYRLDELLPHCFDLEEKHGEN